MVATFGNKIGVHVIATQVTLAAATDTVVVGAHPRNSLSVFNIGSGASPAQMTINFDASAATAGMPLGSGSSIGNGYTWTATEGVPDNAIHAYSAAGTTILVLEGY